jgi:flagellar motor protein MotB
MSMQRINFLKSSTTFQKPRSTKAVSLVLVFLLAQAVSSAIAEREDARSVASVVAVPQPIRSSERLAHLEESLQELARTYSDFTWKRVENATGELEITLSSDSLFQPGSASFDAIGELQLKNLIQWISDRGDGLFVKIESHTDDRPVVRNRKTFKSNWELSAARAGAVATLFEDSSFPKRTIEAVGMADSRPLGTKRVANRRIVLRLSEAAEGGT